MFKKIFLYLKNLDWILFLSIFLLSCFGLIEIYSIALGKGTTELINFHKQIIFIIMGILIFFVFVFIDFNLFRDFAHYIYLIGIILLISVLLFGTTVKGTTGWFEFKFFSIQPVEFIKIVTIIFLARFFALQKSESRSLKNLFLSGLGIFILFFLVTLQPDFGSAMILFFTWLALIAFVGFKKKYFLIIGILFLLALGGMWNFYFQKYQKERILTFLNPKVSSLDQGYNVSQAIIAVGSGGIMGRGVGFGSQSQLKFLPEAQNDFIFAVIAEELGFIGVSLVLLFFGIFFYRLLHNLKNLKNDFAIFFVLGVLGLIFIEMFINISMNIGFFPVVGIPFPFVSYGGSALIANFILIGIVENIIIQSKINY